MDGEDSGTDDVSSIYVYNGVDRVPNDVTHVRVAPSVTVIPEVLFQERRVRPNLEQIDLNEGLIRIENNAFEECNSLKMVNLPSTLEDIGESVFRDCEKLDGIILPEGLQRLGQYVFAGCRSLKRINIPPDIERIEEGAFFNCIDLTEIAFSEGLREIEKEAFSRCKSLVSVTLPSSLTSIGIESFEGCERLKEIHMPDTIENIQARALKGCNFMNFRFPSSIGNDIDISIVGGYTSLVQGCLVSLELPETTEQLEDYYDDYDDDDYENENENYTDLNVRNIALPSECVIDSDALYHCTDLGLVFGVDTDDEDDDDYSTILDALKHRFDKLPVHKICYYQSYHDNETTLQHLKREVNPWTTKPPGQLNTTGKQQDCLGMTPLHILACSTKQHVEMYQLLIDKYPETLITKDKWGDIPLLYALWCNATSEVVDLLVESYKTLHQEYEFDWKGMIETSIKRRAPLEIIQKIVSTHQKSFSNQYLDMKQFVTELAAFDSGQAKYSLGIRVTLIETFRYLLRKSISKRLDSLDIRRWCTELENSIKSLSNSLEEKKNRDRDTQAIYDRLATYESIKEGTSVLELVLWKTKIDTNRNKRARVDSQVSYRDQCRINCRADIVIRNVLPYLIPK